MLIAEIPWVEFAARFTVGLIGLTAAAVIYVKVLLWVGRRFRGAPKTGFSLLAYLFMAAAVGTAFVNILETANDPFVRQS